MNYIKYILTAFAFIAFAPTIEAQETNYDVVVLEKLEKESFMKDGVLSTQKDLTIEERVQEIKTKENQHHLLNQKRAMTPILVEKRIHIDNDKDENIDVMRTVSYSILDNQIQDLTVMSGGMILYPEYRFNEMDGKERRIYDFGNGETKILGYFDENKRLNIEVY